jgi:ATP-dependent 26S proteasome regulatory subunit
MDMYGGFGLHFHQLPRIGREGIILPEEVLERVELHTVRFSQHRERLLAAGQHIKRGLLLHGPPGTGKTLTAMYLAAQMRDRTILLLTGRSLGLLQQTAAMARILQPAMIILEDVDLIAEERTRGPMGSTPLLFELLNEMDGLASDADVIFLLTTNRPDLLEPALAARPGRIDQAIEIPLPDADCRRRLLDLYGSGSGLRMEDWDGLVARTEGVSAAFIRELVRKAILFAAERGSDIVTAEHLDDALRELVVAGGELTRSLLGAQQELRSSHASPAAAE